LRLHHPRFLNVPTFTCNFYLFNANSTSLIPLIIFQIFNTFDFNAKLLSSSYFFKVSIIQSKQIFYSFLPLFQLHSQLILWFQKFVLIKQCTKRNRLNKGFWFFFNPPTFRTSFLSWITITVTNRYLLLSFLV